MEHLHLRREEPKHEEMLSRVSYWINGNTYVESPTLAAKVSQ